MLSFENAPQDPSPPPPPPCHNNNKLTFQTQTTDHSPLPSFSIRDFVFTARNANIHNTWPFSPHHLQHYSQINHLLPPFEPPQSVRKHILTTTNHQTQPPPLSQLSHSDHAVQHPQTHYPKSNDSSVAPSAAPPKCRFILKFTSQPSHPTPTPTHTDDITSNPTDSMTSKVCPVCKTFSSTSNTTLNAHIDQCLVVDSTSKWMPNHAQLPNHIPKPTKKRSMLHIYETAPRCTLEELDRRNGSNWASDSSLLTTQDKPNVCDKMQRLSVAPLQQSNDEYPVYFDSTGTKIRIISKFSNTSIPTPKAGYGPRRLAENGEDSKIVSNDVKKNGRRHNTKPRSMKISEVQERNHRKGKDSGKEDYLSQIMRARHGIKPGQSGTLRRLVCSKRTNPLTRVNGKNNCQGLRSSSSMLTVERNKVNFCNSSLEGSLILSSPLESAVSSSDTINADSSFYETQVNESGTGFQMVSEKTCNPLRKARTSSRRGGYSVKLPKSSGTCASSPRSKRVEIDARPAENRDSCAKDNESILSNELVNKLTFSNLKFKMNTKVPTLKKPRTHRSIAEMENQVEAKSDVEEQYDCVHDSAENLPGSSPRGASHNLDGSSDELRLEVEEVIDQFSNTGAGALVPRRGEAMRISERRKAITNEEASCSRMHCQDLDVDTTFESHVRAPLQNLYCSKKYTDNFNCLATGSGDIPVNIDTHSFTRKADDGSPISKTCSTFPSEISNLPDSSDARSNSLHSSGEHKGCVCGTKTVMPSVQEKWTDSQVTLTANDVHRIIQDSDVASEDNSQLLGISSSEVQCTRYGADPQSVPASFELLLPSLLDLNSEHLQEKSSLSSNKMPFGQGSHVAVHRDPSESPVSAISTNSHHTIPRANSKFLDPEACAKPSAVQDRLVLGFSGGSAQPVVGNAASSLFMIRAGKAEIINAAGERFRETTISPTEDCVKFNDDETCCCFWQKSLCFDAASVYQDPLIIKDTRETSTVSAEGKYLPCDASIRSETFVNTNSFPTSRINDVVAPICEPQRGLISHSSADGAHRLTSLDGTSPGPTFSQVQDDQSSSNPVLRLMGKNLMVVNQDEDMSGKHRQPPPGSANTCGGTKYMDLFRYSPSVSDQDCVSGDSVILSQDSCHRHPHFLDDDLSKGFNHICSTTHQKGPMIAGLQGFDSSTRWNGLERRASLQIKQKQHINKVDMFPFIIAPADLQHHNHLSSVQMVGHRIQEVIVIDDSPEGPDESSKMTVKQTGEPRRSQQSPAVVVVPSNQNIHQRSGGFSFHTSANSLSRSGVISRRKLVQLPSVVPWRGREGKSEDSAMRL